MPDKNKFSFTNERIEKLLPVPGKQRAYFYDTKTAGFRVKVSQSGTKTFQAQAWSKVHKKPITKTLGPFSSSVYTADMARTDAVRALAEIIAGKDIEAEARSIRDEDTFADMFDRFMRDHSKPHKKTWAEDESRYALYMSKPLGAKKVSWFTADRVRTWHRKVSEQKRQRGEGCVSQVTANHALKLLSVIFSTLRSGQPNPCKEVKKFKETSRDRFLKPEEIRRFFESLNHPDTPELFRDYALISLFTGARRDNVLAMRWRDLNMEHALWTIRGAESKNSQSMNIPLTAEALEILKRRKKASSSVFVFATPLSAKGQPLSKTGHYCEPKKAWKTVCKRANLEDVKLHDLRRTLGSYMAITGANTVAVGKALGHKSTQSTAIYARMGIDPVRVGMQTAVDLMKKSAEQPVEKKVVNIRGKK